MPKRRRLKSATHTYTNPTLAVHDRKATQLPANAIVGVVEVDDPYQRGERIHAVASLRDDPLGALWARHQIDDAKFMAGRHWQRLYESVEIGARGVDLTCERVDGGRINGAEVMTDQRRKAVEKLTRCSDALGRQGDALVRDILGKGMQVNEAAMARGCNSVKNIAYFGQRLRECLETLAYEFGYGSRP